MKFNGLRLFILSLLLTGCFFGSIDAQTFESELGSDFSYYPRKRQIKPYMGLGLSENGKSRMLTPFEERKNKTGVALSFGFRF